MKIAAGLIAGQAVLGDWPIPYASLVGLKRDMSRTNQRAPLSLMFMADQTASDSPGSSAHKYFWIHYITFAICIKALCIVGNVGMAFAPLNTVNEIKRTQETGALDSLPYVAIMFTGAQWCFYGLFAYAYTGNKGFLIVIYANILGAVLGSYYAFIFQKHCSDKLAWKAMTWYCKASGLLLLLQFVVLLLIPMERGLLFCGGVAAFLSVMVTISPLVTIGEIYRTKSVRSMPVELTLVSFGSSIVWTICGVMLHDWWILIPNILGIFVGSYTTYLILSFSTYFQDLYPKLAIATETMHLRQALEKAYGYDGCTGGTH